VADQTENKSKRRIRKVETVRELSAKANNPVEEPSRGSLLWRGFAAPARFIGKGFAKLGRVLGKFKVMRVLGRILLPRYFRNSWKELRQVTWPTFKQSRQLTGAVILFAVIFGVVVALLDFGLDKVFKQVLLK
jgi:preprotein translocase SecE subunit